MIQSHLLKAVCFDLDRTINRNDEFSAFAWNNAITAMQGRGLVREFGEIKGAIETIIKLNTSNHEKIIDDALMLLGVTDKPSISRFVAIGRKALNDTKIPMYPYPDALMAMQQLRAEEYNLYIVTRGIGKYQWDKILRLGLIDQIVTAFITDDYGFATKDVHFYQTLLKLLNAEPHEVVMIGDNEEEDIKAPKGLGINTVRVQRHGEKEPETEADHLLSRLDILPDKIKEIESAVAEKLKKKDHESGDGTDLEEVPF